MLWQRFIKQFFICAFKESNAEQYMRDIKRKERLKLHKTATSQKLQWIYVGVVIFANAISEVL